MNQEAKKLLFDALKAAQAIQKFISGRSYEDYE
jgi:uncharacterized protein with HEPN domain